jgi:hypothetical protein
MGEWESGRVAAENGVSNGQPGVETRTGLVADRYDYRHLDEDVEEFRGLNPTSENGVRGVWKRQEPARAPGLLRWAVLRETERNTFTYEGEGA